MADLLCTITHYQKLMKSVGSHGSLSLLLVMKVWSDALEVTLRSVMTTLIVGLSSNLLLWIFFCNFIDLCLSQLGF